MPGRLIIYFDENLPKHLAQGFQLLQFPEGLKTGNEVDVRYIPNDFGRGVKDEDWIPQAGKLKACVITQDLNINRRKHELALYRKHKMGMFFLRGPSKKKGMSVWEMVQVLAKHWPEIVDKVHREQRPFAYQVRLKGKMKEV